jgi:hypothetical protein
MSISNWRILANRDTVVSVKRGKLLKRTELARGAGPKRTALKRKPRKTGQVKGNYRATATEWVALRLLKLGRCRVCGDMRCTLHHLLGGNLRSDVADNLIPLCGNGTRGCHGIYTSRHDGESFDSRKRSWFDVASAIRRTLTAAEKQHVLNHVGEAGLERRYPAESTVREA